MAMTDTKIQTRTAPNGVMLRPATVDDADAVADLFNACSMAIHGRPETTAEWLKADWDGSNYNMDEDTRVAIAPDGALVGYADLYSGYARGTRLFSWVRIHPDWGESPLGTLLMDWLEGRAHRAVPHAPEGAQVTLIMSADNNDTTRTTLARRRGMSELRYFWHMLIEFDGPPPAPAVPDGITIRPMREGEERAVFAAGDEAFEDHFGHVPEPFEQAFNRWWKDVTGNPIFDPSLFFVAEAADGELAGVSLCWDHLPEDAERGWVGMLGVRRPWRRQGLALALLHHSFGAFYERGRMRAGLGVDADSLTGATRLYEKAGMHVSREFTQFGKVLREGEDLSVQTLEG